MYIHFAYLNDEVIFSNLPSNLNHIPPTCEFECKIEMCPFEKKEKRHGKVLHDGGYIYLCIYDNKITNKIFKRYFDVLKPTLSSLITFKDELVTIEESKTKRLKHNINNYNAKIKDELEEIIPHESIYKKDWKETLEVIEQKISKETQSTAFSLMRIFKYINLINAEMDVYELLNDPFDFLELQEHSIHRVVGTTIRPFWLDFVQNNNPINMGMCYENVLIDYPTISVVLGHIWDNAAKYIGVNSPLNINFSTSSDYVILEISMQSIKVEQYECEKVFEENYSGRWAGCSGKDGDGIGMYISKKLIEMNKGIMEFICGNEVYRLDGIPYANNKIILKFLKKQIITLK